MGNKVNSSKKMTVLQFFISIIWPYRWYIIGQLIIHCIWASYVSVSSYLTKRMIDVVNISTMNDIFITIKPYALAYFFSLAGIIFINRLYAWLNLRVMPLLEAEVTRKLSASLVDQSYRFYQDQMAGSLANNIRTISSAVPKTIELVTERIFRPFITIIIALWTVSQVSWLFGVALLSWFILFIAGAWYAAPRLRFFAHISAERMSKLVGQLVDMIGNTLTVRLFGGKKNELKRINVLTGKVIDAQQQRMKFFLKLHLFQGTLFVAFMGINLYLLIRGFYYGSVTAGDFALILLIAESTSHLIWRIAQDMAAIAEQLGVVEQGLQIIASPISIQDVSHATPLVVTHGKIEFEQVYFGFQGAYLFEDLSITIFPGQKVGLVGYSGSGKTTFVNLILRLFEIEQGRILIDNQNIKEVTQDSLRSMIAFIPQDPILFHRTIYENITYANPQASYDQVMQAVERAHADEFIKSFKKGYQTEVGERGGRLSGGQRQRIAIARAFLKNSPILILDEATSQLDAMTEKYIQESLDILMQGKTTLVIAHRLTTLLHMDRILVFDHGKIIQDGTHEHLVTQEGLYKDLWEHQSGGFLPEE